MPYDDKQLDDLLDRGLREYSRVEPRDGLEDRILANLQTQPEPRPWWRVWVPVLAAATVIAVIAIVTLRPSPTPQPQVKQVAPTPTNSAAAEPLRQASAAPHVVAQVPVAAKRQKAPPERQNIEVAAQTQLPRQAVFPSPVPLTEQEKLILALLHNAPNQVLNVAAEQEKQRARSDYFFRTGTYPDETPSDKGNTQ